MVDIELLGRSHTSGTYAGFQKCETASRAEFKTGTAATARSVALVEKLGSSPQAMGCAGASCATKALKAVKLAPEQGGEPAAPTAENLRSGNDPLSKRLDYYTAGNPGGDVETFLDCLKSDEAKKSSRIKA